MYAFGVLLWEMLSGERAWHDLTPPQIMVAITCQNKILQFPSWTMHDIARLVSSTQTFPCCSSIFCSTAETEYSLQALSKHAVRRDELLTQSQSTSDLHERCCSLSGLIIRPLNGAIH